MSNNKQVLKNYIFNMSYQLLALIVPLITTPYISRVLKADGIGVYSYTYSIVCYFTLCAISGTATYGNKKIGALQDNQEERTKKFWDIFSLRFISSAIAMILYIGYVFLFADNKTIALIQSFYILGVMFDVSWFFQGMEDFKRIAIRNYIFKIINVVAIFIFVRQPWDLWKYVLLLSSLTCIGNISIWPHLKKYLIPLNKYKPVPFKDIKIILQLFVPAAALQVYAMLDKTMIGMITNEPAQNGYYEQSEKIVKMCLMLVTALSTVLLPKLSKAYAENKIEEAKEYLYKSYKFVFFLGTALMFGVAGVATVLVPVFFGNGYEEIMSILPIMSLLFVVMGLNQTSGTQVFIASGNQNEYTKRIIVGGIVNIFLNGILIPLFGALGAAIASVVGEIVILMSELRYINKKQYISYKDVFVISQKYVVAGIIMFAILKVLANIMLLSIITLILLIVIGALIYTVVLMLEKEENVLFFIEVMRRKFSIKKVSKI